MYMNKTFIFINQVPHTQLIDAICLCQFGENIVSNTNYIERDLIVDYFFITWKLTLFMLLNLCYLNLVSFMKLKQNKLTKHYQLVKKKTINELLFN